MTTRPSGLTYQPALDGVRAICVVLTICNHVPGNPWFLNGTIGVDVFFALSGYLITTLLLREHASSGAIDIRAFWIRRVFRILPLYVLTIGLYFAACIALSAADGAGGDMQEFVRGLPYFGTLNSEYRPADAGETFGHAWSIGIEEKYYLLYPVIVMLLVSRRSLVALALFAVCAAALFAIGLNWLIIRGYVVIGISSAITFALARTGSDGSGAWGHPAMFAAMLAALYAGSILAPGVAWNIALGCVSVFLIHSLVVSPTAWTARLLGWGPLAWIGRLSYGIYCIHVLVRASCELLARKLGWGSDFGVIFALTLISSVVAAFVLAMAFERPLIGLGRRLAVGTRAGKVASRV